MHGEVEGVIAEKQAELAETLTLWAQIDPALMG